MITITIILFNYTTVNLTMYQSVYQCLNNYYKFNYRFIENLHKNIFKKMSINNFLLLAVILSMAESILKIFKY